MKKKLIQIPSFVKTSVLGLVTPSLSPNAVFSLKGDEDCRSFTTGRFSLIPRNM